jgi:transcriptional regulator with XRE-family HTH domain
MTQTIRIIAETADTVTVGRSDFQALVQAAEDAEDLAALTEHDAEEAHLGRNVARRDYLTADEAERLLEGESPVKIWREKRRFSQRALARTAGMQPGYLAEIETGRKRGSVDALSRLSAVLGVAIDELMNEDQRTKLPEHGPVLLISSNRLPGTTGINSSPWIETEYPSNASALAALRALGPGFENQFPYVVDKLTRRPIFSQMDIHDIMAEAPSTNIHDPGEVTDQGRDADLGHPPNSRM